MATSEDGRQIHYCRAGTGDVTVLFESGMGKSRNAWATVAPAVAEFAKVVTYDRAGSGRSHPRPGICSIEDMISDHLALRAAAVEGPCIVVGHSYGGPIARGAAVHNPTDVLGIVLVDEVSELCDRIVYGSGMRGSGLFYNTRLLMARLGLLKRAVARLQKRSVQEATHASRSNNNHLHAVTQAVAEIRSEEGSVQAASTALAEWEGFTDSIRRFRDSGPWVPDAPMTTISANRLPPHKRSADYIATSHKELIDLSNDGRHIFSRTKSHNIHLVEPDTVIAEIRRLAERLNPAGRCA